MIVTRNIPNLIGGISQQPAQSRLANQCEDQLNYISTPASGLTTRPPLKFKSAVPYTGNGAFFLLDRDVNTRYNLWISPEGLHVEDLSGNVQTIDYRDNSLSYLSLDNNEDPRDSYRILPVADTCFIINRTKRTAIDTDSYTVRKNQALIHIKQVAVSTTWSVVLNDVTVSFGYSSKADQAISTEQVASTLASELLENASIAAAFDIVTSASVIAIRRKDGASFSVGLADTRGNTYSSLTTWKIKNYTDLPTTAPDGFVCCVVGSGGDTSDDYYVRFIGQGESSKYQWTPTGIELSSTYSVSTTTTVLNQNPGLKVGTVVSCSGAPTFKTTVSNINVNGNYAVINFADRFPSNPGNLRYRSRITNDSMNLMSGVWEECEAPDQPTQFDATTMPHALYHDLINDTWTFRPVEWNARTAGDDDSAPFPSFINKPLTSIFLYRNRLGLIAGDSVSMSAAGDLERFFPLTVQTLADDEPIDISVAVDDYSDILATATVQDNLLFWSKKRQYTLSTPEILSPKTAAILPTTAYSCMPDAGLPVCGSHIFFCDGASDYLQLYEYVVNTTTMNKEGLCVSNHVPSLIPFGEPSMVTASQSVSVVAVHTAAEPNTIYLYQYYVSGENKIQSAWSRHTFAGTIKNIRFREAVLWIELFSNNQRIIGTLDFSPLTERTTLDYVPCLDFLIERSSPSSSITLPFQIDDLTVLVSNSKGELIRAKNYTCNGNTITFDNAPSRCVIGLPYERTYTFSKQYPALSSKQDSIIPLTNARFQLKRWKINHYETSYFTIHVENEVTGGKDEYKIHPRLDYDRINRPVMDTRQTNIPCRGRNTEINVWLSSNNYLPETFLSVDVELNYINKTRIL